MNTPLDPRIVFNRGLDNLESLSPPERLVFLVMNLETVMDLEGWDHFFASGRSGWHQELKAGLHAADDTASANVLTDYTQWLAENGVTCEPEEIASFVRSGTFKHALSRCRDRREDFSDLSEVRWQRMSEYLLRQGYALLV